MHLLRQQPGMRMSPALASLLKHKINGRVVFINMFVSASRCRPPGCYFPPETRHRLASYWADVDAPVHSLTATLTSAEARERNTFKKMAPCSYSRTVWRSYPFLCLLSCLFGRLTGCSGILSVIPAAPGSGWRLSAVRRAVAGLGGGFPAVTQTGRFSRVSWDTKRAHLSASHWPISAWSIWDFRFLLSVFVSDWMKYNQNQL